MAKLTDKAAWEVIDNSLVEAMAEYDTFYGGRYLDYLPDPSRMAVLDYAYGQIDALPIAVRNEIFAYIDNPEIAFQE